MVDCGFIMEKSSFASKLNKTDPPTKEDIAKFIECLIEDTTLRDAIADWATYWYFNDQFHLTNEGIRGTLYLLMGADAITIDRPFLFQEEDFRDWLDQLQQTS